MHNKDYHPKVPDVSTSRRVGWPSADTVELPAAHGSLCLVVNAKLKNECDSPCFCIRIR